MFSKIIHYILLTLILTVAAIHANAESIQNTSAPIVVPALNTSTDTSSTDNTLERLESNQVQLKTTLDSLQKESAQLQTKLLTLTHQLEEAEKVKIEEHNDVSNLQQLTQEETELQTALTTLRKEEVQLKTKMETIEKQLTQLSTEPSQPSVVPKTTPPIKNIIIPPVEEKTTFAVSENPPVKLSMDSALTVVPTIPVSPLTTAAKPSQPTQQPNTTTHKITSTSKIIAADQKPVPPTINNLPPNPSPSWRDQLQDPVMMLRIGGCLIAVSLFLFGWMFWPKKKSNVVLEETPVIETHESPIEPYFSKNESNAEQYDFLETKDVIQNRLDLASGYVEMGQYDEAKEALKPVLEKGDAAQKEAANALLKKITYS